MSKALIKLTFTQIISSNTLKSEFSIKVFEKCYEIFCDRASNYQRGARLTTWDELSKLGESVITEFEGVMPYFIKYEIPLLNGLIPTDYLCSPYKKIDFLSYNSRILSGDMNNKDSFSIEIFYTTDIFTLIEVMGDNLLIAKGDKSMELKNCQAIPDTFILQLVPGISITEYKLI